MSLTSEDIERIAAAVTQKHKYSILFDDEDAYLEHQQQHIWLESAIRTAKAKEEESKAKKQFYISLLATIIQWSIPVVLGSVIYYVTGQKPT
jgi:hypothetical protein